MNPRKKLIEVSIPLEAINRASVREKSIRHGHPSTLHLWWARRPLAACRAVLFAQLVDDPSAWPDRFPTDAEQDAERKRLHKIIERMVPWEASNDEEVLTAARWEIARSVAWGLGVEPPPKGDTKSILDFLQTKAPPVYDPFSGGGSIPLEAQRLGLRAYGSDLNPVAVLIGKALVEIPPKFAGQMPVNPTAQAELNRGGRWNGKGAAGLAEDVRYYGKWMRDEAEKRIGHFYPKAKLPDGSETTIIAWLWARTVRSPDPAAKGAMVPLVSSFMLSTKEGRKTWVEPVIDSSAPHGWRFEVRTGVLSKSDEARLKEGTIGRSSGGTCILSGASMPFSYVREQGQTSGLGVRLMAVVVEAQRGRMYLPPTDEQAELAASAVPAWQPEGELPNNPRDFKTPNYGMSTFASLFTSRQLLALTTFSDLIVDARDQVFADANVAGLNPDTQSLQSGGIGTAAYADAVATYLGLAVSKLSAALSTVGLWSPSMDQAVNAFGRQAIPMTWDFPESNTFNQMAGDLSTTLTSMTKVIAGLPAAGPGHIVNLAAAQVRTNQDVAVATDPPYYDNIIYADLSDYFYVWLRSSLSKIFPDLFRRLLTPKDDELVASAYRHADPPASEQFFLQGMEKALGAAMAATDEEQLVTIYYAFKQSEIVDEGLTSAGWSTFLQAVLNAGLMVDGTWPVRTERATGLKASMNALASSVVLVCRKQPSGAATITRADFVRLLKRELPEAIADIRKAGVGPVDMQQSVIGPGMGVFSRHARILEDDDSRMTVKTALAIINRVWGEIENEADAALDAETQVALAWFASYGFDARSSGELITLANAKNVPQAALFTSGVFTDLRGRTQLTPRDHMPLNWQPQTDKRLTIWECVQHTARALRAEDGGEEAAARLIGGIPTAMRAEVRQLSDRLFQIATDKGWAPEALIYNELSTEWHRLTELAQTRAAAAPAGPAQSAFDLGSVA